MKIIQASFFWKNDKPGGLGFTFGAPGYTPEEVTQMFTGKHIAQYMRDSDNALGSSVVNDYFNQLQAIVEMRQRDKSIPDSWAVMAALNIMWLTERGFIPNDEFNGMQFLKVIE